MDDLEQRPNGADESAQVGESGVLVEARKLLKDLPPAPEQSMAALALQVINRYLQVCEGLKDIPGVEAALPGTITTGDDVRERLRPGLSSPVVLSLNLGQYAIRIIGDSHILLQGPKSAGDDSILYRTDMNTGFRDGAIYQVAMNVNDGVIDPELTPSVEERLRNMLTITDGYYQSCLDRAPTVRSLYSAIKAVPNFPQFPASQISAIRSGVA